jgi:hypothetical protein
MQGSTDAEKAVCKMLAMTIPICQKSGRLKQSHQLDGPRRFKLFI